MRVEINEPMTTQEAFEQAIANNGYKNGHIVKITYKSVIGNEAMAIKVAYYRLGVRYNKIQRNIDKWAMQKAMGIEKKPRQSQDTTINTYLLLNKNGELKVRLTPTFNSHLKTKSTYYYKGVETSKEWLLNNGIMKPKTPSKEAPTQITIMLKDILAIG